MSEEHMATAREVTRDWTPQTTLADSRRDIANALAAAEERGRRKGVEERDKLRETLKELFALVEEGLLVRNIGNDGDPGWTINAMRIVLALKHAKDALAPRVPHASEGPPCAGCGHPKWQHQYGSKEHAFCCAPLDELQRDYCRCKNYLAPRDSGKEG